jgi:ABC-type oligopeptide transport system ATPase subunit
MSLLSVLSLYVQYRSAQGTVRAVDDVSFDLEAGETVGLVGESGCGKSTLSKAIMRLAPSSSGRVVLEGQDITHLQGAALKPVRKTMQMIFQDPTAHSIRATISVPASASRSVSPAGRVATFATASLNRRSRSGFRWIQRGAARTNSSAASTTKSGLPARWR